MKHASRYSFVPWFFFALFFSVGLVVNKAGNLSYHFLLLIALGSAISLKWVPQPTIVRAWLQLRWIFVASGGMAFALLVHQLSEQKIQISAYDNVLRIAFLGVLTWVGLLLPSKLIKSLRWFFLLGAVLATAKLTYMSGFGQTRVTVVDFVPLIAYSQLVLLLSVFSVLSIGWNDTRSKFKAFLLILSALIGLYNIYLSQARGAWIAVPVFIVLTCLILFKNIKLFKTVLLSSVIVVVLIFAASATSIVQQRISDAKNDIHLYIDKVTPDTSIGIRFQLWKGAWVLFKENLVFGVGKDNFPAALKSLENRGIISKMAAGFPHSHNEILYNMATLGLFGLLGILTAYFVPIYYFCREIRHADQDIKVAAAMGLSLCLGYFIFGLVDVMFMWRICNIFYVMSIAIFMAFIIRRKMDLLDA
ncbi:MULTISPECIES: O-antigen ligase family protein [unclassified Herbaspirillum]|uniref:O-antigen ligase family protein n=1 Tax=unclassified Herbaspirillum TaxID=2624150 RepID=UPI000E2F221C|nr:MULTISPECIES: O-antigen ligase family protein [unclassified Herbaspirillum]RFB65728.1 O-antigen ligase domain-containing protein [Herbaspirillum sp. 3R-3a1]TFI08969.1 O-antigen ligase domain-containing protein [Herbaspirillum sp. 3R11]TFI15387.1 O-antigen ligase domain-containing protein [Herbaspirillum sp. 3R-11]TFI31844.1 O-antigen ligase domain-containing protein [Herbaspirillum sp. 3C11]